MTRIEQPEDTEGDDETAGAELDLLLPLDKRKKHRERQKHHEHCQQMADR